MNKTYVSYHRNSAKRALVHYLQLALSESGVRWSWENAQEVEGIVDSIVEATKDELRHELLETTLARFSEGIANNRLKVCALPGCGVLHNRKGLYCSVKHTNLAAKRAQRARDKAAKAGVHL